MIARKASEGHPLPGDLPVELLMQKAVAIRAEGADVYFKFTCAFCGERCTLAEKNKLYAKGECHHCLNETIIDVGGLMIVLEMPKGQST